MKEIIFSTESLRDLDEIWTRIAQSNLDAAERLIHRIERDVVELARFPGLGHRRADVADPRYRFWAVGKYIVAYRCSDSELYVVRVVHGARDFRRIFRP